MIKRATTPDSKLTEHSFKRHAGALRPLVPKLRPVRIVGFDTEDYEGTPVAFAFFDGAEYFYTKSTTDALTYIYNQPAPTCFVCHNLQYDIANLFKQSDYGLVKSMVFASRLISVTLQNANPKELWFQDSCSFFAGSLAALGDLIGIPKQEGSAFNPEYCKNDARICQVFMSKIQDRLNQDGVNLTLTLGSMAMSDFRTNYMPHKILTHNTPLCLDAYYGGRVEMFYKGSFDEAILCADINSSYPTEMFHREYPDTGSMESSSIHTHQFGVGRFVVDVPDSLFIPPLPYHSPEGRLFFPTGRIEGAWTYAEVRYALSKGCTLIEEKEGEGTHVACRPFQSFIDTNYGLRLEAKSRLSKKKAQGLDTKEEEFEILYYKLKMNNLYGKFSQHKDKTEMTRDKKTPKECEKLGVYTEGRIGPFYQYRVKRTRAPRTANYLWGTYVTAYARISLLEKLYAVHDAGGTLLYCDTDSVMFAGEHALPALQVGGALGEMSVERFDSGDFVMAKGYVLYDNIDLKTRQAVKLACKGVNQEYGLAYLNGEKVRYEKPNKLKSSLIQKHAKANVKKGADFMREHEENAWNEIEKTQRTIYFKRKGDVGVTLPVNVDEIDALERRDYSEAAKAVHLKRGVVIIPPEFKKSKFIKDKMPKGWEKAWFKLEGDRVQKEYSGRGIEYLSFQRALELAPGASWFSGVVLGLERTKRQKLVFRVDLETYTGHVAAALPPVAVPSWYFSEDVFDPCPENFIGKRIEIFMVKKLLAKYEDEKYIGNTPLKIRGKILE